MKGCASANLKKTFFLVCFLAVHGFSAAQNSGGEPYTFLRKYIACSQSDLAALQRGVPLAKVLQTDDPNEVAIFGAIRVQVPAEFFLQQYRDIVHFKRGKEVLQIEKFSHPPRPEDLGTLTLDQSETDSLKGCMPGDCSMKLTSEMIARLRKEVIWSASTNQEITLLFRQMLLDYVTRYLAKGNEALAIYDDKTPPIRLADQLRAVLQESPYLNVYVPAFESYLASYPNAGLPGGEDFLYWSKEQFGAKPVVSITHVAIDKISSPGATSIVIGSKQIFADHYFTASLGLGAFTPVPDHGANSDGYLMYLNRSRVDLLGGFFNFLKRWVLNRRLRQGIEENLRLTKKRLESAYGASNQNPG